MQKAKRSKSLQAMVMGNNFCWERVHVLKLMYQYFSFGCFFMSNADFHFFGLLFVIMINSVANDEMNNEGMK